jgi:DNA-binding Lrp family transcriptional regulator
MDDLDRKLLALLRLDARSSASKLAAELKVSRGTVQNRIDRMLARGAIQGFTVRVRPDLDNDRVRAVTLIEIKGERASAVVKALRGFPQVVAIHTTNGRWDLVVELETENLAAFSRTLDDLRRIEGIGVTETNLLLSSHPV